MWEPSEILQQKATQQGLEGGKITLAAEKEIKAEETIKGESRQKQLQ